MTWPHTIPHDLKLALAELDSQRATTADSDRWGVIKEWLEHHGVEAPDKLPVEPESPTTGFD